MDLKGKYLKYDESITEEVFDRIIKTLGESGWKHHTDNANLTNFRKEGYLTYSSAPYAYNSYHKSCVKCTDKQIQVSDILGEGWDKRPKKIKKSRPVKWDDMVSGRYYRQTTSVWNYGYIFRHGFKGRLRDQESNLDFRNVCYVYRHSSEIINPATPEEVKWLEACEKAGKFIPRKEALKDSTRYIKCTNLNHPHIATIFEVGIIYEVKRGIIWACGGARSDIDSAVGKTCFTESTREEYSIQYDPVPMKNKKSKEWWNDLKKGDYAVLVSSSNGRNAWENSMPENYIYILSSSPTLFSFYPRLDTTGSRTNGWHSSRNISDKLLLRKASDKEIEMYKHAGKPVDVTTYKMPEEKSLSQPEFKVGDWVTITEDYSSFLTGESYRIIKFQSITCAVIDHKGKHSYAAPFIKNLRHATTEEIEQANTNTPKPKDNALKPLKTMSNDELLAKAIRDYPVGTVFAQLDNGDERNITSSSHYITSSIAICCGGTPEKEWKVPGVVSNPFIYKDGTWAKIISKPDKPSKSSSQQFNSYDEFYEEAKRRGYIGAKVSDLFGSGETRTITGEYGDAENFNIGRVAYAEIHSDFARIYDEGKRVWAAILEPADGIKESPHITTLAVDRYPHIHMDVHAENKEPEVDISFKEDEYIKLEPVEIPIQDKIDLGFIN